ncbi:MAG: DNRLRE domain-containing protein, partial [Firmicutes bacterium]|nr:DNRLRE domain-containing protein [Bacillota bacterium]
MTATKDAAGGITFFAENDPDEMTGGIAPAFMNDAGGKAYSEDIRYELAEAESGVAGVHEYVLRMILSEKYLDDPARCYPVTVDPSVSWTGSSNVKDAYVISGSYQNTNFYSSSVKKMPAGSNGTGKHRTYIKFTSLASKLSDKLVVKASLDVYDYGEGTKNQTIYVRRATSSWSPSSIKWT